MFLIWTKGWDGLLEASFMVSSRENLLCEELEVPIIVSSGENLLRQEGRTFRWKSRLWSAVEGARVLRQ